MFLHLRFPIALTWALSSCQGYMKALAKGLFAANEGTKERCPHSRSCLTECRLHSLGLGCVFSAALTSLSLCNASCCVQQLSPYLWVCSLLPPQAASLGSL